MAANLTAGGDVKFKYNVVKQAWSSRAVLSNLFRMADHLALKIHLPRPTSIEGNHFVGLVQLSFSLMKIMFMFKIMFSYDIAC